MSPWSPRRPCAVPRCPGLAVARGRCALHATVARRAYDAVRTTPAKVYMTARWRALRQQVIDEEGCCRVCRATTDLHVDHVVPHHNDDERFWARENLQVLCRACHSRKSLAERHGR